MKLQMQAGSLRVRLKEADLARLLDDGALVLELSHGNARLFALEVALADASAGPGARLAPVHGSPSRWRLELPGQSVRDHAQSLPNRDALVFGLEPDADEGDALREVAFEVDVRDSLSIRGAARKSR